MFPICKAIFIHYLVSFKILTLYIKVLPFLKKL
jgi:hypothetical protein